MEVPFRSDPTDHELPQLKKFSSAPIAKSDSTGDSEDSRPSSQEDLASNAQSQHSVLNESSSNSDFYLQENQNHQECQVQDLAELSEEQLMLFPDLDVTEDINDQKKDLSLAEDSPVAQCEDLPLPYLKPATSDDPQAPASNSKYSTELSGYSFNMFETETQASLSGAALTRINKEIKSLSTSLPCEAEGSVFVSMNSKNLGEIYALISGPAETPYEHGLYLFSINLDGNYPNQPPNMNILTTGGGVLRFNPNLYDSGFVCLSIINTWDGDPEEMWNPTYSTLLQVLLSIQALVMDKRVIQKEPGYECYEENSSENQLYCSIVKYGNIKFAMTEMLKNPPEQFKEVVNKHFALKKEEIIKTVDAWLEECPEDFSGAFDDGLISSHNQWTLDEFTNKGVKQAFKEAIDELKVELENLPVIS